MAPDTVRDQAAGWRMKVTLQVDSQTKKNQSIFIRLVFMRTAVNLAIQETWEGYYRS